MSHASTDHPLDLDLADYVEGNLNAENVARVESHLATCLLCRIKRQRLADAPPIALTHIRDLSVASFGRIEVVAAPGSEAVPGELWMTSSDPASMVVIRKIRENDWGVIVVPATLDVEVADSGTLVLSERASPIGAPLGIYNHLTISLPLTALAERVVPSRPGIDLLNLVDGDPGVSRGTALEGPADPRHEIRQYLIDQLVKLDPYVPGDDEDDDGRDGPTFDPFEILRDDLDFHRAGHCFVDRLGTLPLLTSSPSGWTGIGTVREFGVHVVVISTPAGLNDDADLVAAGALLTRLAGSALVVTNPLSDTVDLFEPPALYRAYNVSQGARTSQPSITGLGLTDTLFKYLDQKRKVFSLTNTDDKTAIVDVAEVLKARGKDGLAATAARSTRFGANPSKRTGYAAVADLGDSFADALRGALGEAFNPETIADLVDRDDP